MEAVSVKKQIRRMRCMRVIKHCFISLFLFIVQTVTAQINYGTTGLMNLPTASRVNKQECSKPFHTRGQTWYLRNVSLSRKESQFLRNPQIS